MNRDVLRLINNFPPSERKEILYHYDKKGLKQLYECFEFKHKNAKDTLVTDPDWRTNLFEKEAILIKFSHEDLIGNGIARFNLYIADPKFYIYDIQQMVRDFLHLELADIHKEFKNNI